MVSCRGPAPVGQLHQVRSSASMSDRRADGALDGRVWLPARKIEIRVQCASGEWRAYSLDMGAQIPDEVRT